MSIYSRMRPYLLYVNAPVPDEFGSMTDHYVFQREVMVALSFQSQNRRDGDIRFTECDYTGVTPFKGLDREKKYKLIPKEETGREYLIRSSNELSRLSQYILQEVLFNE